MAKPQTSSWTKLTLWLGDGASPEDFEKAVCGFTTKSFTIAATFSESTVPDCDDADLPAWIERVTKALDAGFKGAGPMAPEVFATYRTWVMSGESKNAYVVLDIATAQKGYFSGAFKAANLEITGNLDGEGKLAISVDVKSDGEIAWVAGAVPA